jgi:two-component system CheB/CheR fusion protein
MAASTRPVPTSAAGERALEALLDQIAVGVVQIDRDGRLVRANESFARTVGRTLAELAGASATELVHPDDALRVRAALDDLLAGQRASVQLDVRVALPDGSHAWVNATASRSGEEHLVAIVQDITARRLAEDALRQSELRFRRLIEKLPAGAYTCDPNGLITFYNEQAVALWGRAPKLHHPDDRFCGSLGLFHADGTPIARENSWMAKALAEERDYHGEEIWIERPDGTRVAALAHASPLRDDAGRLVGSLNILVDSSERKQAEAMLRGHEERFQRFMQHLPGLAWIKDLQGRYLFVNDAAAEAFQKSRAELYGRTDAEVFPAETSEQFRENDHKALASSSGVETIETLEHADGVHHSLVSKFPIPGPDGRPAWLGGIAIDITARMRAEEALREADRRKDEFLATLAHELRNPLAPIRSSLEVLREIADAPDVYAMLERQVDQMVRLVEDLLEVSRITRGRVELRREAVELADVLRAALETSRPALEAGHHDFELSLPDEPLVVDADPVRLAQVFVNLLDNAAKYTPDGGHVALGAARAGAEVRVWVRDDGVGIPGHVLPRVFEPFTQSAHTLPRAAGGLGIGLALVAQLVDLHGGRIAAHSEGDGRGSEFVVTLPLAARAALPPSEPAPRAREARPAEGRRVLVVDDNRDAAESLAMLLRTRGVDADVAHDGPSALERVRAQAPSVVLLDIGMPGMDGYEVARRMRADTAARDALLVAVTGWGQPDVQSRCEEAGFDQHLVKPVRLEALEALLGLPPRVKSAHP